MYVSSDKFFNSKLVRSFINMMDELEHERNKANLIEYNHAYNHIL